MGLTQKLGLLAQSVQQDTSLNIGIGGAANASYKLQVTGATNLTGALTGTSATFSSSVTATSVEETSSLIQQWSYKGASTAYRLQLNTIVSSGLVKYSYDLTNNSTAYPNNLVLDRGNVGIGTSSPSSIVKLDILLDATAVNGLQIRTSDAGTVDGSTTANVFRTVNSSGGNWANAKYNAWDHIFTTSGTSERMRITSGGLVYIYSLISTYTTAQAANMYVNPADGAISRSTSSIKYKNSVTNYDKGLDIVNQLRPVYYKGNNDGDTIFAGLIAEEVHDLGLTEFVQYSEDGTPDSLAYSNMVSLLVKAIQELKAELDELKNK